MMTKTLKHFKKLSASTENVFFFDVNIRLCLYAGAHDHPGAAQKADAYQHVPIFPTELRPVPCITGPHPKSRPHDGRATCVKLSKQRAVARTNPSRAKPSDGVGEWDRFSCLVRFFLTKAVSARLTSMGGDQTMAVELVVAWRDFLETPDQVSFAVRFFRERSGVAYGSVNFLGQNSKAARSQSRAVRGP